MKQDFIVDPLTVNGQNQSTTPVDPKEESKDPKPLTEEPETDGKVSNSEPVITAQPVSDLYDDV
jgi:hypothetical protein